MEFTLGSLPSKAGIITEIPIVASIQPFVHNESDKIIEVNSDNFRLPRCSNCRAYFSCENASNDSEWFCSMCTTKRHIKKPIDDIYKQANHVIVKSKKPPDILIHVFIVFKDIKNTIKEFLNFIDEKLPVVLVTIGETVKDDDLNTVCGLLEMIDDIEFPNNTKSFSENAESIISVMNKYQTYKCWYRIFIDFPYDEDENKTDIIMYLKNLSKITRVDFYIYSNIYSAYVDTLIHTSPGVSRVFSSITEDDVLPSLKTDYSFPFVFKLVAHFYSGFFEHEYIPYKYILSKSKSKVVMIPVFSSRSYLSYALIPPSESPRIRSHIMQLVCKYVEWNPKWNRLSCYHKISTYRYDLSDKREHLVRSISYKNILYCWMRSLTIKDLGDISSMTTVLLKKMNALLLSSDTKDFVLNLFVLRFHPLFGSNFSDRVIVGNSLSLADIKSINNYFDYKVEVWQNNVRISSGLVAKKTYKRSECVYIVKSFPNILVLSDSGDIEITKEIQESLDSFRTMCHPITVKVIQAATSGLLDLLHIDEEEGLADFLESVNLPHDFVM